MIRVLLRFFTVNIPKDQLIITFSRSSGPGGQNVNKLNTKADVRFEIDSCNWLNDEQKSRLKEMYPHHINKEGEFFLTSQSKVYLEHREQFANERDALEKLQKLVERASEPKKERNFIEPEEHDEKKKKRIEVKRAKSEYRSSKKPGRYDF